MPPKPELPRTDNIEAGQPPAFDVNEFLTNHGLEAQGDRMVRGHDGSPMPLQQALIECDAARAAIEAAAEMARDTVGEGADINPAMTRYLDRMEAKAKEATVPKTFLK